ncbi:MAG: hypothetical protein LWW85_10115, partial [Marinilabiliales bacterium]|nr:hypothetical protein [Marinilabiliales bacterium]
MRWGISSRYDCGRWKGHPCRTPPVRSDPPKSDSKQAVGRTGGHIFPTASSPSMEAIYTQQRSP